MLPPGVPQQTGKPVQLGIDDLLGDPFALDLMHTTFVVLDLETTGGSPHEGDGITEVGAVIAA